MVIKKEVVEKVVTLFILAGLENAQDVIKELVLEAKKENISLLQAVNQYAETKSTEIRYLNFKIAKNDIGHSRLKAIEGIEKIFEEETILT